MKNLSGYTRRATPRFLPLALITLAILVGAIGTGCGGSESTTDSGNGPSATDVGSNDALPDTPWTRELANVSEDGSRSLESALRLFSIAFGPMPGVDAPTDRAGIRSATIAVDEVRAHDAELTTEQRAAIAEYLKPPENGVTFTVTDSSDSTSQQPLGSDASVMALSPSSDAGLEPAPGRMTLAPPPPDPAAVAEAKRVGRRLEAEINQNLKTVDQKIITYTVGGTDADDDYGMAVPSYAGGFYSGCTLYLYEPAINAKFAELANTAAHEIFHCFEFAMAKTEADFFRGKGWLVEGSAEWVGAVLGGPDKTTANWWRKYLALPGQPLFSRTYDAMGFYAHLVDSGLSPWDKFPAMFTAVDNIPAFAASGANGDFFLDSWAAGYFRAPERGHDWDTTGPGIIPLKPDQNNLGQIQMKNGVTVHYNAKPYANSIYAIAIVDQADVIIVQTQGRSRISDGSIDRRDLSRAFFCANDAGCDVCPDGSAPPVQTQKLGKFSAFAVTGGTTGSSGTVSAVIMDDFCQQEEEVNAVAVHFDRPEAETDNCEQRDGCQAPEDKLVYVALPGRTMDLVSCDGPFGTWKGVMRQGGIDTHGFLPKPDGSPISGIVFQVPWADFPVEFTVGGEGAERHVKSTSTGVFTNFPVPYDLDITVSSSTMTIVSKNVSAGSGFSNPFYDYFKDMTIEPAPAGSCP